MSTTAPRCVGFIMDGNRRWAKKQGIPTLEGHRAGCEKVQEVVRLASARGIAHVAIYAFSTENWNREPAEVSYLMDLFYELIKKELRDLGREGVRIRFAGQTKRFSPKLQEVMTDVEKETEANTSITVWICLSYGGRAEIVEAARAAALTGEITEESLSQNLWTNEMPEPDMIIRTSGEKRISGFLTWKAVYSELFFTDTLWPDFSEAEFDSLLEDFAQRERRHGK